MAILELVKTFIYEWYCFIRNPTWWKRRTSMERGLTLVSIIVILIGLALAIALGIVVYKSKMSNETDAPYNAEALTRGTVLNAYPSGDKKQDICLTPGCVQAAANLIEFMDTTVDPCDDFYKFSCGNFIKTHNIPDDKSAVTTFSIINDALEEQLRAMIEEPIQPGEPKPFALTKTLYKACMNKTSIKDIGLKGIKGIVKEFGGWPVVDGTNWKDGDFDWRQAVYKYRKVGYSVDYLIDFSVGIDLKNSTRRLINLDQAALGLKREFLMNGIEDKFVKAYYEYMVDISVIFGADRKKAEEELMDSLKFEMNLANISLSSEERRNATALYNPMTIDEMQEKYQSIPWLEYINTLLAPDTSVKSDEVIVLSVPKYITDLENLLSITPKRIQSNYLLWRAVASTVSYLTDELRTRQLQYHTVTTGKTERVARWKECIDLAAGSMPNAAGALYVRKYFHEDARQNALQMVADIRAEFKDILRKVDWMDDKTRDAALEKADAMQSHIAYPDELLDDKKLEEFYDGLDMNSEQYLKSAINLTLFATRYAFKRLRQPVNKTDWVTHGRPAVVNAFYSSIENSIQFPAGILQGIFFNNNRPHYMNYGGIGFVIGHEITHGFDDQGRQFDKNGNLVDWWAPETQNAFIKKTQCIIDQYSNYTVPEIGLNLNGINTQGENIADNGGIRTVYKAYQRWAEKHGPEPRLPGLDYTPNQLFWMTSSSIWCNKNRPETMKMRVLTGYHSPGEYRVLGSLSNSEEFAKDFNCPSNTKMNPMKKCKVWY